MGMLPLEPDYDIYYERIAGDDTKPCLVFLHEGLGCTAMWKSFPTLLCERTGCPGLSYDRLGYGQSSGFRTTRTIDYLHEAALQELPRVLGRLVPDHPYFLVGHSDGGSIALILAAERPPLLRGIVVEAAHVMVEPESLRGLRAADEAYEKGGFAGLHKYHGEKTAAMFKAWSQTWQSDKFQSWNIRSLLPSINCPVLVIQGCDDEYATKAQVTLIVAGVRGEVRSVLLEHCGHTPHTDQEHLVLDATAEFIANAGCG